MAETLKFGPQWLHNLLDGGQAPTSPPGGHVPTGFPPAGLSGFTGPGVPRTYKLAEHRYGREEMLALYMPSPKIPDGLRQFHSILKEQALQPLALIQPSEDEQRLMSQSVNSVAVLRMMGRGTGGPAARGGRGGGDRGRGRGRGRGESGFAGFHRQTSLEDDGVIEKQRGFERGAIGFGGPRSGSFEDGPTSPRRDFSRSMSSDNWRDARGNGPGGPEEEEGGDWRRAGPRDKWGTRGSWRDHRERDRDRDFGRGYDDYEGGRGSGYDRPYRTKSGSWGDGPESDLPEWSTAEADDMDNIGTFDSSGAFCFIKDRDVDENEQRRRFEAGRQRALAAGRKEAVLGDQEAENGADTEKEGGSGDPEQDRNRNTETADKHIVAEDATPPDPVRTHSKDSRSASPPAIVTTTPPEQQEQNRLSSASPKEGTPPGGVQAPVNRHHSGTRDPQHQLEPSPCTQQQASPPQSSQPSQSIPTSTAEPHVVTSAVRVTPRAASPNKDTNNALQPPADNQQPPQEPPAGQQVVVDDDFGHLEKAAEDLVATWTAEEDAKSDCKAKVESGGVPLDHEDAKKWFYRDPQGDLQGPFKAAEMAEWFSAGYFTMNLLVKRGCDGTFQALGELIKRWGRVPFLPGPSPPPFKDPTEIPLPATPQPDPAQGQLLQQQKLIQQQMMMQQQMYLQQVQMSQMMATQQQQETFPKLTPQHQQQQQLALQFMLKHQLMGQQAPGPSQPTPGQHSPPQQQPQPGQQQPPQSMSPRAEQQAAFQRQLSQQQAVAVAQQAVAQQKAAQQAAVAAAAAAQQQATTPGVSQAGDAGVPGFQRSVSQPHTAEKTIWGSTNPTTSAGWTAPTSVWDIEQPKAQSMEEIQRLERIKIEKQREEVERREAERRRQDDEIRKRQEEEERRRQEKELRRRQDEERRKQVEMELERQRIEQLERIRLRESEENARREEERRRREEEERRRREQEEQRLREAEERRRLLEEQRRTEQEELERKRQEEIRRRQEKAEEMRRQQQESLRRLQQEQMANMHLPSSAQWGSSATGSAGNGTPSLSEIQEMEAVRAAKEAEEKKRRLEQQRQQLATIQQQQQQQNKTWAQQSAQLSGTSPVTTPTSLVGAPSLLEIQQEQALQLQRDKQQRHSKASPTAALPLRTAAVWTGAAQATHWAAEGAWGNLQNRAASAGFWDDAIGGASTKKALAPTSSRPVGNGNSNNFPSLSSTVPTQQQVVSNKTKSSKVKREEESVQRLFQQAMKPKDEFTQWCENALRDIQSSVDVPTFIVFLQDVESPYEVHDYVRSYLGESKDASEFATQFLERRSKYKNHLKQPEQQEEMWGPAPAVNPNLKYDDHRTSNNNGPSTGNMGANVSGTTGSSSSASSKNAAKKKKRMLKVDSSILGFRVHADPERVNMGNIEPIS